jgi:hypothetical protein
MQVYRDQNAPALTQAQGAATAMQTTPQELQQNYGQTPNAQFRSTIANATPEQFADPLFTEQAGLSTGAVPPVAGMGQMIGYEKIQSQNARSAASVQQRAEAARGKLGMEGTKLGLSPAQSIAYSSALGKLDPSLLADIPDSQLPLVAQRIALMALAQATIGLKGAQTGLAQAHTKLTDLVGEIKENYANGRISPQDAAKLDDANAKTEAAIASERSKLATIPPKNPEYATTALSIQRAEKDLASSRKMRALIAIETVDTGQSKPSAPLVYDEKTKTVSGLPPS